MSKRKDAVALYEAISKTRLKQPEVNMSVPSWMGPRAEAPTSAQPASSQPGPPQPGPPPSRLGELQQRAAQLAGMSQRPDPVFSTSGGRLRVSLNYVGAGIAGAGVVLLLLAAFVLGRSTAPSPKQQAAAAEPDKPPLKKDVVRGGMEQGPVAANAGTTRVKGKHYIVIQDMMGKTEALKDEALKIAAFCTQNGKPASVILYLDKTYIVWSLTPFESDKDPAAKTYAADIETLGKQYQKQGGRYDFMQRKTRNALVEPMFIRQPT